MNRDTAARISRGIIGLVFVGAGVIQITTAKPLERLIGKHVEASRPEVARATGVLEIAAGASIFVPSFRRFTRMALIGLLLPGFRDAVAELQTLIGLRSRSRSVAVFLFRLPVRLLMIVWVLWATSPGHDVEQIFTD